VLTHRVLISALAVAAAAVPAQASISYYSSLSTYTTATSDLTNNALSLNSLTVGSVFSAYTNGTGDVTFTGSTSPGGGFDDGSGHTLTILSTPASGWPSGNVLARTGQDISNNFYSGGSVVITFSSAVTAVAFLTSYVTASDILTVTTTTASATDTHSPNVVPSGPFFVGIRTTDPITSITITANQNYHEQIQIGAFEFADLAASTPEPGSLALLGLGLVAIAFFSRRGGRNRKAPACAEASCLSKTR